jgi:hypothetical protein
VLKTSLCLLSALEISLQFEIHTRFVATVGLVVGPGVTECCSHALPMLTLNF